MSVPVSALAIFCQSISTVIRRWLYKSAWGVRIHHAVSLQDSQCPSQTGDEQAGNIVADIISIFSDLETSIDHLPLALPCGFPSFSTHS